MDPVLIVREMRRLAAEVDGVEMAYAPSETDANRLPEALNAFPCVVLIPGGTVRFLSSPGGEREHAWRLRMLVAFAIGNDLGFAANAVFLFAQPFIDLATDHYALGGLACQINYADGGGVQIIEYGGISYVGYELVYEVLEEDVREPQAGSLP